MHTYGNLSHFERTIHLKGLPVRVSVDLCTQQSYPWCRPHTEAWAPRTTTTRESSERLYYKYVREVQLLDWIRKFRQWYVVDALLQGSKGRKRLLVTREVDDAKRFVNALASLLAARDVTSSEPPGAVDDGSPSNSDQ